MNAPLSNPFDATVQQLKQTCDSLIDVSLCSSLKADHSFAHGVYWNVPKLRHSTQSLMENVAVVSIAAQAAIANLVRGVGDQTSLAAVALREILNHTEDAQNQFEKLNTLDQSLKSDFSHMFFGHLCARVKEAMRDLEALALQKNTSLQDTPVVFQAQQTIEISTAPEKNALPPQILARKSPPPAPGPLVTQKKALRSSTLDSAVDAKPAATKSFNLRAAAPTNLSQEALVAQHNRLKTPKPPLKITVDHSTGLFGSLNAMILNNSLTLSRDHCQSEENSGADGWSDDEINGSWEPSSRWQASLLEERRPAMSDKYEPETKPALRQDTALQNHLLASLNGRREKIDIQDREESWSD